MIVVLWGVSGCGKSTIGKLLADRLGWEFIDADDFHPQANIDKMRLGIPLEDEDRYPWLDRLAEKSASVNAAGDNAVLACSALTKNYRDRLGIDHRNLLAVHLQGSRTLIQARLEERSHEFMSNDLLASQFATLEPTSDGHSVSIKLSRQEICEKIIDDLGLNG